MERWDFTERTLARTSPESFELLVVLSGTGSIVSTSEAVQYKPAEVWLLPAGLGDYQIAPESPTSLLRAYVPDLQEFTKSFAAAHVDESTWSRVVYP